MKNVKLTFEVYLFNSDFYLQIKYKKKTNKSKKLKGKPIKYDIIGV